MTRKKAIVSLRERQVQNAFFLLLLAQGTPCILAGDEFGNTQKGNNNVYCQDNPTGWTDWSPNESRFTPAAAIRSMKAASVDSGLHSTVISAPFRTPG